MKVGFIGAGNMAGAIVKGLIANGVCKTDDINCLSGTGTTAAALAADTGIHVANSKSELIEQSDIIVLGFKPQHLETISSEEAEKTAGKLVVSILAGRTLESMAKIFQNARNLIRVMPNTPSQIGQGVSTYCFDKKATDEDEQSVKTLLGALGTAHSVAEDQLHIATVLNGCGPALYFRLIDLLADAAEKRGLSRAQAITLATETGIGSLELLKQSTKSPAELVSEVVSPNGVTHALLTSLDRQGLPEILDIATEDAVARSIELSKM